MRWHPDLFTPREAASPTLADILELARLVGADREPEDFELVVAPRVRRILRRRFLAFRKAWPRRRRFRRGVHRAYRKAKGAP